MGVTGDRSWYDTRPTLSADADRIADRDLALESGAEESIMANIITLYHGTIYEFDKIDVTKGQIMTDKAIDALISLIEPDNLPRQFFIGTQCAADLLCLTDRRIIR